MKGYFSRIASQTGLHFSAQGDVPARLPEKKVSKFTPAPSGLLDHEETVLVRPPFETKNVDTGILHHSSIPKRVIAETIEQKPDQSKIQTIAAQERFSKRVATESPAATILDTTFPVETGHVKSRKMEPSFSDKGLKLNDTKTETSEIVKPVSVKPSVISEQHKKFTQADIVKNASIVFNEPEKLKEKHYFSKTAEIISGRDTDPAEVQTILLREIQEWVGAGNSVEAESRSEAQAEAGHSVNTVVIGTEPFETEENILVRESKQGVVRIGEKHNRKSITNETSRILEQSFDLSIGTISVVIEDNEYGSQMVPVQRTDNKLNRQDREHKPSRLSRNYL